MSAASPESVVRRYYEAFNTRNLDAYAELFAADAITEAPGFSGNGADGARAFDRVYFEAFPKARIESLRMTTVGRRVATANWMHGGKHEGPLRSAAGAIPPTHAELSAPYAASFIVEGGKITLQRVLLDAEAMPAILGLVP